MHRFRSWWWFIPIALPVLVYAGLIITAYIKPPLHVVTLSVGYMPQPAAIIEVESQSRWPVTLAGVAVKGVLPPDEVSAIVNHDGEIPTVATLMDRPSSLTTGELKGWRFEPKQQFVHDGVKLIWYQNADVRWINCPTVRYRYLGWPMAANGFCSEPFRGPALSSAPPPTGQWGPWQSVAGGVRYRTQRYTHERQDDLWIEMEPDEGAPRIALTVNRFAEEPAGGHTRFNLRVVTIPNQPGAAVHYTVPLRWGEPTPEIKMEAIPVNELR